MTRGSTTTAGSSCSPAARRCGAATAPPWPAPAAIAGRRDRDRPTRRTLREWPGGRHRRPQHHRRRHLPLRRRRAAARPLRPRAGARTRRRSTTGRSPSLGCPGARKHMRQYPIVGTTVLNVDTSTFYRFVGGAPLPLVELRRLRRRDGRQPHVRARWARARRRCRTWSAEPPDSLLPHDRRSDVPHRGRRGRPAHGLRAARRLRGRDRRSTRPRSRASARVPEGRHGAARAAVQAHVGDRRRQAAGDVHHPPRRGRRRRRRDRPDPGRGVPRPHRPRRRCSSR